MPPAKQQQEEPTTERVVAMLSATYFEPGLNYDGSQTVRVKTATRGQTVKLSAAEEARLDDLGALLPPGADPADAQRVQDAKNDAYRAERGDQEALQRHAARLQQAAPPTSSDGGIVRTDAPVESGAGELANWIRDAEPTADETIALAEGDPERASVVLEAENTATGQSPRPDVQSALEKIIAG